MPPKKKASSQGSVSPKTTAAPKAAVAAAAATESAPAKTVLTIDYPLEGEIVTSPVYTIRLTALDPASVEVSFNNGKEWSNCRESMGNWWFDWSGYRSGPYMLAARMTDKNGKVSKAKSRSFTVLN